MAPTRLLVIGMDGASPELLLKWTADGTLPHLARLRRRGRSGKIRGLDGFFIGSTWPSIYTGVTPARHGFHYLIQLRPGSYDSYRPADYGLFDCDPFWRILSRAGQRVAILDGPLSVPDPSLHGIQILEWGSHDAVYGFRTHPAALADSIRSRFGDHPVGSMCDGIRQTVDDYRKLLDALVRGVERKCDMTLDLLLQGSWDLFMQTFSEAHCAGHQCWHLHDISHPAHDRSISAQLGDPLKRVYQAIDTAIGRILESAGDGTVFAFSSHGMSHWYGAQFLLPEILFRLGVACPPQSADSSPRGGMLVRAAGAWLWRRLPGPIRSKLGGIRDFYHGWSTPTGGGHAIDVDPRRSQCFHQRNGLAVGGIRLNIAGREPEGILRAEEADAFCDALTADLMEIRYESSGNALVRRVLRVEDLYEGPRLAELPDLLVEYNDGVPVGSARVGDGRHGAVRLSSPKIGVIAGVNGYGRTGEHRAHGLLFAAGPHIQPDERALDVSVLDLAPTWTQLLGVEFPQTDGIAIAELQSAGR